MPQLPPWILTYSLAGYEYFPDERVRYLEQDIAQIAQQERVHPLSSIADIDVSDVFNTATASCQGTFWCRTC